MVKLVVWGPRIGIPLGIPILAGGSESKPPTTQTNNRQTSPIRIYSQSSWGIFGSTTPADVRRDVFCKAILGQSVEQCARDPGWWFDIGDGISYPIFVGGLQEANIRIHINQSVFHGSCQPRVCFTLLSFLSKTRCFYRQKTSKKKLCMARFPQKHGSVFFSDDCSFPLSMFGFFSAYKKCLFSFLVGFSR